MQKIILVIVAFLSFPSNASYVNSSISYVRVDESGHGIISFATPLTDPAGCSHSSWKSHLSFDLKTEAGRAIYSLALTAYAANKNVVASGNGSCNQYTNVVESWITGYIH